MISNQPFVEYSEVSVTDPLRQGDVIEATDSDASKWQRHLLIITADCDFAHAKHQGRVTCVPLLTQEEYLMEFQIPRISDRIASKAVGELQRLIATTCGPSISETRLKEWPSEQDPAKIVEALRLEGRHADEAQQLLIAIRKATLLPTNLDGCITHLIQAQVEIPNGKQPATARRELAASLKAHYVRPPGDALFLSAVAPNMNAGYFVYLRHLEQIHEPEISRGPRSVAASYRRLARLHDRFTHAISQQFAMVFMAIGLPPEYEEARNLHSELIEERYR